MSHSIEVVPSLALLSPDAQALLSQAEHDSFDLHAAWFELLSRTALPAGAKTQWLCSFKGAGDAAAGPSSQGRGAMVVPLLLPGGASNQPQSLSTYYSTLYRPAMAEHTTAADVAQCLRAWLKRQRVATLSLEALDPEHRSFELLRAGCEQAGLVPYPHFAFGNWYLQCEGMDWESYLKTLSSKLRNTLKRLGRKFEDEVQGRFAIVTQADGPQAIAKALADYEAVYASSWKTAEPYPQFMPGLVDLAAAKGWLRLGVAHAGEQPVAAQLWLVVGGRACIYKVAYDEKFGAYSPGALLTGKLMQHALEVDKVREVDYLVGDDNYKRIWMSHRRERFGLIAYNPKSPLGLLLLLREATWRRIKPTWLRVKAWQERRQAAAKPAPSA